MKETSGFVCRRCGACCRIANGYVRLTDADIADAAAFLGMAERDFIEEETDLAPDRRGLVLKNRPDGACAWLSDGNLCRLEPAKPQQCRTFPFSWRNADSSRTCPGLAAAEQRNGGSAPEPPMRTRVSPQGSEGGTPPSFV